ncbi:hypothetical protein ONS95_005714 [Cadophora gregata]|uniref:uncharacterized protein n=1 Tax=Cadophora gregata TaxID=51156 RepID=UPI0026DAE7F1|nr:uncharacterized protein ONS95_005714 [Cadophora gregata]KAK0103707.1 hypothetical protein ONS95_005714 [Cadophora gregata]
MPSELRNIAIIGGGGSVGNIILDTLIREVRFNVTILTRKSSTATFPAGITVINTDYSQDDLVEKFKGQDAVISVVGMSGFSQQKSFIDAAISAGVKRFIPSEFSSNTLSPAVLQLLPMFGQKKEVLEYLKEKESSGLTWTTIWPALLFDSGLKNGFLGFDIASHTANIWDQGTSKFTLTNDDQLGRSAIAVLDRPDQTANKNIYIASFETSQKEVFSALEQATAAKWSVTDTTTEKEVAEASEKIGKGDFSGAFALVRATSFGNRPGLRVNYVRDEELSNELLGLEFGSVGETVSRVVGGFA